MHQGPRPALRGQVECDVAIVGGGIAGLTAAILLRRAGQSVVVIEKGRLGGGDSGLSSAHVTEVLDVRYHELLSRYGHARTVSILDSKRAAIDQIAGFCAEPGDDCDFAWVPGYLYTEDEDGLDDLRREHEALRALEVERARWSETSPLPFRIRGAICWDRQARIDPVRYVAKLVDIALREGVELFESSLVNRVDDGSPCLIHAEKGTARARSVIVATHVPVNDRVFLQTKLYAYRTYMLSARLAPEGAALDGLFWDTAEPYHYVRTAIVDGERLLLLGGEDHRTGSTTHTGRAFVELSRYLHSRFDVRGMGATWSGQVHETLDNLPLIGRNPGDNHVYVASGFAGNGTTFGTLAGLMLSRLAVGEESPWSELYQPGRLGAASDIPRYVKENSVFPYHFLADRLRRGRALDSIGRNEGAVVRHENRRVAAYRDEAGQLHMVSAVCPHLGCEVHWNRAESSWDCPCHGSRFDVDGRVLNGPANCGLKPILAEREQEGAEEDIALARPVQAKRS